MLKVLLLAGNTLRAKAYAQQLRVIPNIEVSGVFYGFDTNDCPIPDLNIETHHFLKSEGIIIPDFKENFQQTFDNHGWFYEMVDTVDVNSEMVQAAIDRNQADVVVFAGYGGQILKKGHFNSKKKYLHMHPGLLPLERGSTTLFYSILHGRKCTVTAFYMTAEIDAGEHVFVKEYSVPTKGVNLDQYFDNCIRADCFLHAVSRIVQKCNAIEPTKGSIEEYYVIHPVLKHFAILSLKDMSQAIRT